MKNAKEHKKKPEDFKNTKNKICYWYLILQLFWLFTTNQKTVTLLSVVVTHIIIWPWFLLMNEVFVGYKI